MFDSVFTLSRIFSTATDSPVRAASSIWKETDLRWKILASAGTLSPT